MDGRELSDQELDDLAAQADATRPARAASFRRFEIWRHTHPDRPRIDDRHRISLVERDRWAVGTPRTAR
jgi:hypothetical protein